MPTAQDIMIEQLDGADLTAQQWRTARRILDRTHPENGYARLSYEEMAVIVESESQPTVRGHLAALAAAGLITYKRNSAVHVYWHIDARVPRAESSVARADCSVARAPEPPVAPVALEPETPARAESSVVRANCSVPRAKSSVVRTASLKATTTSRLAGLDTTASQPAGKGFGENQPQPPTAPASAPLTETQQRALAMLVDPAIGLDEPAALRIARKFGYGMVLTQCCRYLRDVAADKVDGPGVIGFRLSKSYGGSILPADHRTAFWERHGERTHWLPEWQEQAEAAAIDADASGPEPVEGPPKPKPEPGTPEAYWAQLVADFALHQPVGAVDSVLQDSWVIDYADGVFTIGIADGFRLDWVEKKLRNQVKRRLAVIMRLATVDVTFRVEAQAEVQP